MTETASTSGLATDSEVDEMPVGEDPTGQTLALPPAAPPSSGPDPSAAAQAAAFDEVVVEAMSKGSLKDKQVLLQAEAELDDFVASQSSRHALSPVLSSGTLNSYQRLLVHRLGDAYKVTRTVEAGRFFLQKTPTSQRPPVALNALLAPVISNDPDARQAPARPEADAAGASISAEGCEARRLHPDGLKFKIMSRTPSTSSVPAFDGPGTPGKSGLDGLATAKLSFEERQAAYAQARERIFAAQGMEEASTGTSGSKPRLVARSTPDADLRPGSGTDGSPKEARLRPDATVFDPRASAHGYEDVAALGAATAQAWRSGYPYDSSFVSGPIIGPVGTAAWPMDLAPILPPEGDSPQRVVSNGHPREWPSINAFGQAACTPLAAAGPLPHCPGFADRSIPPWLAPGPAPLQASGAPYGSHGNLGPFPHGYTDAWGAAVSSCDIDSSMTSAHRFPRPSCGLEPSAGPASNASFPAATPHRPSSALSSSSGSSVVTASSTFSRGPPLPRHNQHHLRSLRQTSYPPSGRPVTGAGIKHSAHRAPQSASSASTSSQSRVTPPPTCAPSTVSETRLSRADSQPGPVRHPLPLKPSWSVQPPP